MANPKHLDILSQGVKVWNQWREDNAEIRPDLSYADLKHAYLIGINLSNVDLSEANLIAANLIVANLTRANLYHADPVQADLRNANLAEADLKWAHLSRVNLSRAGLNGTQLQFTEIVGANLDRADFSGARFGWTKLGDINLGIAEGLDRVIHEGPSIIGIDTIYKSKGIIPKIFLRGAGMPDAAITYIDSLQSKTIQYYSCFISYSSKDETFAKRLHTDLQQQDVRCWFASEDMKIGDKIRSTIDKSIKVHDKLLLILSEHSVNSEWVESEVEAAREEERKRNQTVLFPIRLDQAVMETDQAWATDIRRTRHIGDFSRWKDHDAYQQAFERLLRDLKAEG